MIFAARASAGSFGSTRTAACVALNIIRLELPSSGIHGPSKKMRLLAYHPMNSVSRLERERRDLLDRRVRCAANVGYSRYLELSVATPAPSWLRTEDRVRKVFHE